MATTRVTVLDEPFGIRSPAPEEYTPGTASAMIPASRSRPSSRRTRFTVAASGRKVSNRSPAIRTRWARRASATSIARRNASSCSLRRRAA